MALSLLASLYFQADTVEQRIVADGVAVIRQVVQEVRKFSVIIYGIIIIIIINISVGQQLLVPLYV